MRGKRALVTGGAGLIGSHLVDLLLREGWRVRILDNLEPQTHRHGKPAWVAEAAEFVEADIRDREAVSMAEVSSSTSPASGPASPRPWITITFLPPWQRVRQSHSVATGSPRGMSFAAKCCILQ